MPEAFLDERRLLRGPWQAFERDVARLLVVSGFDDVRLVGGSGDRGADVVGVKNRQTWVVQCKFVSGGYPTPAAIDEAAEAARFYQADRMLVAVSRPAGPAMHSAIKRWASIGVRIELLEPRILLAMAKRAPEYAKDRRALHDYQQTATQLFEDALRETDRGQVVLATGLGKTIVMAETVAELWRNEFLRERRVLVCAGTRELVDQLHRSFWTQLPSWVATHQLMGGETPAFWEGITFATMQSAVARLDDLPAFDLLLVDEAHHIGSESFRKLLADGVFKMVGGVTATPWRGDGFDIDSVLGQPVMQMGIAEGLRRGFLCEADYRMFADNIDWDLIRNQSANSYSIKELNQLLLLPTRDEEAAKTIASVFTEERRNSGIVFCSTVLHAHSFAGTLRMFGLNAEAITGEMSPRERDVVMTRLRKGELDVVTTRDLFNEGVDVPDVDLIAFMRVTHSRRIFVQQLGRGLRTSPGKDRVVVLDFVSDLRRISEVIELDRAVRGDVERLQGSQLIRFRDLSAGSFMLEWMKDQADLFAREGDATLEIPRFNFPEPGPGGGFNEPAPRLHKASER